MSEGISVHVSQFIVGPDITQGLSGMQLGVVH